MKFKSSIRKPGPSIDLHRIVIAIDGKTRYRGDVYEGNGIFYLKNTDPVTQRTTYIHVEPVGNKHGDYRELPRPMVPTGPMIPGLGTGPNTLP